jgi:hypothetical protein
MRSSAKTSTSRPMRSPTSPFNSLSTVQNAGSPERAPGSAHFFFGSSYVFSRSSIASRKRARADPAGSPRMRTDPQIENCPQRQTAGSWRAAPDAAFDPGLCLAQPSSRSPDPKRSADGGSSPIQRRRSDPPYCAPLKPAPARHAAERGTILRPRRRRRPDDYQDGNGGALR